jgi:hypothetical protein
MQNNMQKNSAMSNNILQYAKQYAKYAKQYAENSAMFRFCIFCILQYAKYEEYVK